MAQFDVLRNIGRQKDGIPFVVIAQSRLFDSYRRRVVIPLVRKAELRKIPNPRLNPTFRVKGVAVVLHPMEIVSVAKEHLGERVGSLAEDGDAIIAALDELFTRAFG
ncbi:MAG TPA: CcdB family protein [Steroidobacteraceae bacterium]|jgi:toxin CcdB|nr:CcdB family protein [Steroidobacteraceae bacterium]